MNAQPARDPQQHSDRLRAHINQQIAARGWIGFDEFMQAALYAPQLGYYNSGAPLAESGDADADKSDFITAPQMGDVFARCLARQCVAVLREVGGDVLEFGAGNGRLAADALMAMHAAGCPPARYFILETSAAMRERQQQTFAEEKYRAVAERVHWLDALPKENNYFRGVMLANEVLDAMPAIRFEVADGAAFALGVSRDGDDEAGDEKFVWARGDRLPEPLQRRLADCDVLNAADGYRSEIGLRGEAWVRSVGEKIHSGAMLLIDYGFPRREFYHPERRDGTLMCHYRHRAHDDPFSLLGLQDISVHVDFTAVSEAAREVDLHTAGYTSQGAFLLALNVLDDAGQVTENISRDSINLSRQIQKLTMPHEMGELFKVIALTKNYSQPLHGFSLTDRRARL